LIDQQKKRWSLARHGIARLLCGANSKQIIPRGTRLYASMDFFAIYNFVRDYEHFNDQKK